jgi:DNA repair protein RadA/Sms
MAKEKKNTHVCDACGFLSPKWLGRCPDCGAWNSFTEMPSKQAVLKGGMPSVSSVYTLAEVPLEEGIRFCSGMSEMDRVLGGGIVTGSVVLVGGEPGIGKSTLLLQLAQRYKTHGKVLYVSGEESVAQIKMRALRLGVEGDHIQLTNEVETGALQGIFEREKPTCVIIDSVQTLLSREIDSPEGSPSQLKLTALEMIHWAKQHQVTLFLIGHITKEGSLAGPKVLEHMVDTVLYFEQAEGDLRVVRATKNRFGSIDEMGFFFMEERGLESLEDVAKHLYAHRGEALPTGVALTCLHEGSRSLVVEIQALTVPSSAGFGRIYSDRVESKRISRLCAVLEKHIGLRFGDQDVYVNISGGLRLTDIATDLALLMALYSARTSLALPRETVFWGEISLSGDVRRVHHAKSRHKAARESGMKFFVSPPVLDQEKTEGYRFVSTVKEAISLSF